MFDMSSFETGLFLTFLDFQTQAIIGQDDLYLDAIPLLSNSSEPSSTNTVLGDDKCCLLKSFQQEASCETDHLDHLLHSLRAYYGTVQTKRQLQLEVPAGFRKTTTHNKDLTSYLRSQHSSDTVSSSSSSDDLLCDLAPTLTDQDSNIHPLLQSDHPESENITTHSPSRTDYVPIIRSVDKPSSTLPHTLTVSEDFMHASLGFRQIDTIKKHLQELFSGHVVLDSTPADAILDPGDVATMHKRPRNTTPIPRSSYFGQVMHMDIVFGPEVAVGNIHFGLLFTDRFSRMSYIYPLRNLTTDISRQLVAFFAHLGFAPTRLITDFDLKLIGGKARDCLNGLLIHVNAAPSSRQDKMV